MFLGAASFEQLVSSGKVRLEGNSGPLEQIEGMFVQFDIGFEILPGTMPAGNGSGEAEQGTGRSARHRDRRA